MITYEKGSAPTQKINLNNSVKTDLRGLGTGVGGFSNLATTMYAMIEQFDPEKQAEQRAELKYRIKLLREIVGQEIDRIKGTAAPIVPKEWKHLEKILPEDTDAEKAEKYKHNSMVITKKPYFFRYLYPELNRQFKQYESSYNQLCLSMFGIKLKQLIGKPEKTDEEKRILRLYQKYSPLITSNCTMNVLCREFESIDFDISFGRSNVSMLPTFENEIIFNQEKMQVIKRQYQKYGSTKQINILNHFFDYDENYLTTQKTSDFKTIKFQISDSICVDIRQQLQENNISAKEVLFYANELSHYYKKFNWGFVWDILDAQILNLIPQGKTYAPVNIKDIEDSALINNQTTGRYLGQEYILKEVTKTSVELLEIENPKQQTQSTQQVDILEELASQNIDEISTETETKIIDSLLSLDDAGEFNEISLEEEQKEYEEISNIIEKFVEDVNRQTQEQQNSLSSSQQIEVPEEEDDEKYDWSKYNDGSTGSFFGSALANWWAENSKETTKKGGKK